MSMTPERLAEIKEQVTRGHWSGNSFGEDLIRELLAEVERLNERVWKLRQLGAYFQQKDSIVASLVMKEDDRLARGEDEKAI